MLMVSYFNIPIQIYYDTDTYIAECPQIQGAFAEGDTPEEATANLKEVIMMIQDHDKAVNMSDYVVTSQKIMTHLPIMREIAQGQG